MSIHLKIIAAAVLYSMCLTGLVYYYGWIVAIQMRITMTKYLIHLASLIFLAAIVHVYFLYALIHFLTTSTL